ncbi:MAG: hypothetical protein JZU64_14245, partial [Rhodoferax sp.]|nr:hypothetical protein [Rhodoferax sp.]
SGANIRAVETIVAEEFHKDMRRAASGQQSKLAAAAGATRAAVAGAHATNCWIRNANPAAQG